MMVPSNVSRTMIAAQSLGSVYVFRPAGERLIRHNGDGVVLLPFGEDLKEEFGASAVEFHLAEFVDDQQIDAAVTGDGPS